MKGVIFSLFNKLVEQKFGLETWDQLLEKVHPASDGVYTTGDSYPDTELFALIGELSKETKIKPDDLILEFGKYMIPAMANNYPVFFQGLDFKQFILNVDGVIHVEVRKLFPDVKLPKITYEKPSPNKIILIYKSDRHLCRLAEGLIDGAAIYFQTPIERIQSRCYHRGDDHCRFEITVKDKDGENV